MLVYANVDRVCVQERERENQWEGGKNSLLQCSVQSSPASPAEPEPTGPAPTQSYKHTSPEEHTVGWKGRERETLVKEALMEVF